MQALLNFSRFKYVVGNLHSCDATAIDVQLNESGVMFPMKSLSFWVRWARNRMPTDRDLYKYQACDLKDCAVRVAS